MRLSEQLLGSVLAIAERAGQYLQNFYFDAVEVYTKSDNTPVTEADLFLSQFISQKLTALTPKIPVLSEENCNIPLSIRQKWKRYWLIDPLDGTQQFLDRSGQFSILISLIENNRPVLGLIHAPILQRSYYAMKGFGAYRKNANGITKLTQQAIDLSQPLKIALGSRANQSKVRSILAQNLAAEFIICGSSGLKGALVAEGEAHCYVRLGKTGEWDTAACEILLQEMGGTLFDRDFAPLTYNQRETFVNPDFAMVANAKMDWKKIFQFNLTK